MERVLISALLVVLSDASLLMPDYSDHPCQRDCVQGDVRVCEYNFTLEWMSTMNRACYNCPFNVDDCFRPHCISADGFLKAIAVVNRKLPGPSIQVCEGDTIVVNVLNALENGEGTSLHWHGIHHSNHQYMDGVAGLTQCPINAHSMFGFRFSAYPAGTHYWHSHWGLQRADGVFGSTVVRKPYLNDPQHLLYDYDKPEHVIIFTDWIHEMALQNFAATESGNDTSGILINGHGRGRVQKDDEVAYTPRANFTVTEGKRYRFRIISNAILDCPFQVSVDHHQLTLISADGSPVEPVLAQSIIIYSGERYDFVLNANNKGKGNHWMRVAGLAQCANNSGLAVIRYDGASLDEPEGPTDYASMFSDGKVVNPSASPPPKDSVLVSDLQSLPDQTKDPALKPNPDYKFYFGFGFVSQTTFDFGNPVNYPLRSVRYGDIVAVPSINNISHVLPASPLLTQRHDVDKSEFCTEDAKNGKHETCPGGFCFCIHRYHIKLGSVVEAILIDTGSSVGDSHPAHIHGQYFRVIGMGAVGKNVTVAGVKKLDAEGRLKRNFKNPAYKDTVIFPDGGYTIIRFHAKNPGEWFFHCHLLYHGDLGMGLVFGVGEESDLPPLPKDFPKCGNFVPRAS